MLFYITDMKNKVFLIVLEKHIWLTSFRWKRSSTPLFCYGRAEIFQSVSKIKVLLLTGKITEKCITEAFKYTKLFKFWIKPQSR